MLGWTVFVFPFKSTIDSLDFIIILMLLNTGAEKAGQEIQMQKLITSEILKGLLEWLVISFNK